jgi:hypothetical protein
LFSYFALEWTADGIKLCAWVGLPPMAIVSDRPQAELRVELESRSAIGECLGFEYRLAAAKDSNAHFNFAQMARNEISKNVIASGSSVRVSDGGLLGAS